VEFIPLIPLSIVVFSGGLVDGLFALYHGLVGRPSVSTYTVSGECWNIFIVILSVVGWTLYHSLLHDAVSLFQPRSRFRQAKITAAHPIYADHANREILIETYDDTNLIYACGTLDNLKEPLKYGTP
jgi:hypothetical protein